MTTAYEIGLKPNEFWELTIREFVLCWVGASRISKEDMRRRAWEVAHHINSNGWVKRSVTPKELLGEQENVTPAATPEEWHFQMRKRAADARKQAKKREMEHAAFIAQHAGGKRGRK